MPPHDGESEEAISEFEANAERKEAFEILARQANYRGNWSNLFQERLLNPKTIEKYITNLGPKYLYLADKERIKSRVEEYKKRVEDVFSYTKIGKAHTHSTNLDAHYPDEKGSGSFGDQPAVFSDAVQADGLPVDSFHKSVIEAHEQSHGVLDLPYLDEGFRGAVIDIFDLNYIRQYSDYSSAVYEITARVTQLKNYFGMKSDETFTEYHLDYAKEHYVKDVGEGIDNMTGLFRAIKPGREKEFIAFINSVAC